MMFWTPAFAGVTTEETFYEIINIGLSGNRDWRGYSSNSDKSCQENFMRSREKKILFLPNPPFPSSPNRRRGGNSWIFGADR